MFVTDHAKAQARLRLGTRAADDLVRRLEPIVGEPDTVLYVDGPFPYVQAPDGSNGDMIVAVAVDGSVDTVYLRRSSQTLDPAHFGARKVVPL